MTVKECRHWMSFLNLARHEIIGKLAVALVYHVFSKAQKGKMMIQDYKRLASLNFLLNTWAEAPCSGDLAKSFSLATPDL